MSACAKLTLYTLVGLGFIGYRRYRRKEDAPIVIKSDPSMEPEKKFLHNEFLNHINVRQLTKNDCESLLCNRSKNKELCNVMCNEFFEEFKSSAEKGKTPTIDYQRVKIKMIERQ